MRRSLALLLPGILLPLSACMMPVDQPAGQTTPVAQGHAGQGAATAQADGSCDSVVEACVTGACAAAYSGWTACAQQNGCTDESACPACEAHEAPVFECAMASCPDVMSCMGVDGGALAGGDDDGMYDDGMYDDGMYDDGTGGAMAGAQGGAGELPVGHWMWGSGVSTAQGYDAQGSYVSDSGSGTGVAVQIEPDGTFSWLGTRNTTSAYGGGSRVTTESVGQAMLHQGYLVFQVQERRTWANVDTNGPPSSVNRTPEQWVYQFQLAGDMLHLQRVDEQGGQPLQLQRVGQ